MVVKKNSIVALEDVHVTSRHAKSRFTATMQYLLTPTVADLFVLVGYPKWGSLDVISTIGMTG